MSKYARHRKGHPVLVAILLILLLIVGAAVGGAFWINSEVRGSSKPADAIAVEIPKGASTADIAAILEENGIIGNKLVFRAYIKYVAESTPVFQYGAFQLVPKMSYANAIDALTTAKKREDAITVTFPEGYNAYQMGEVLEQAGLCSKDDFILAVNETPFTSAEVSFWDSIVTNDTNEYKIIRLDGYLFPDTYQFFPEATPQEIVLAMLKNFEKKAYTEVYQAELATQGLSLEEWVVFASIIQKEAANVEEMYNVSSVFHNRLLPGSGYPQLESCTTNNYIRDYIQPDFAGKAPADLLAAYDTYGKTGFPAGAIANAGLDALDATLHPAQTPYYFFVTDVEYTHYYGKTFQEHLANIEKAKAVNKTHGIVGLVG